jgi:hypothetical protein
MNASDIVRLLNTDHYAPADLAEVNQICRNYPEFGIAHMLKVRIMEVLGHEKDQALKVAAVYAMDRKKLLQLVTELHGAPRSEPDPGSGSGPESGSDPVAGAGGLPEESGAIQFADDMHQQADVIIEQHAPYAGQDQPADLLELDEDAEVADSASESPKEATIGDFEEEKGEQETGEEDTEEETEEEELTSENLITALVKNDTDMEEPDPDHGGIPTMDVDEAEPDKNSNEHLIRNFIQEEPGVIRADKKTNLTGDVSLSSIQEHDGFITDTLAKIYVKQGLYAKAIYAYEKLSLKYPEKSAYFAAQIEKIRNINHS